MSLLEQDSTRKRQVELNVIQLEYEAGNDEEYKVEGIWDSIIYTRKSESGHLLRLYYLVSWKDYPKKEGTWKPALAIQHLRKLIKSSMQSILINP